MNLPFADFFRPRRELTRFSEGQPDRFPIVFYAEDGGSWTHLEPVIRALVGSLGRRVAYLTSSAEDPVLTRELPGLTPFCIGDGSIRTWLFSSLQARVMVMTMPDLQTLHIRRSRAMDVHYVYLFHSMVSTHMIYREAAFDHFDTLLCPGPSHMTEIRAAEQLRGLPAKTLIAHGYGRLDAMLASPVGELDPPDPAHVLVAPSWGAQGLLELHGAELTRTLLDAGLRVTVRPHPMTGRKWPGVLDAVRCVGSGNPRFVLDTDMASPESLHTSHAMISDWSGAALEYAFGLERPVLFVDVPRKVRNPRYGALGLEPLEVSLREQLGALVHPDDLASLPERIHELMADAERFVAGLRGLRDGTIFNVGKSGEVGARTIARIADERCEGAG